jgi:hypothetical protein
MLHLSFGYFTIVIIPLNNNNSYKWVSHKIVRGCNNEISIGKRKIF